MAWVLGIDFGTSFTSAAICAEGRPEPIEIDGQRRIPSVVLVDEDGSIVVGAAAERLSATRPGRTLREPKRRLGEPTPVVLGGEPYSVVDLVGALLAEILAEAERHMGSQPSEIRLTHPASWGRPRLTELRRAAAVAGMASVTLVPEPVAAAVAYAADSPSTAHGYVAVYDLGGGTFDTAVLRHTDGGFTIHGRPGGDARLGGELFDELLARHVTQQLAPEDASAIVASDELAWRQAAANLRSEARHAKETLSSREYAELLVALPTGLTQFRVTRDELESLISDHIDETVDLLERAVADAGVGPGELTAIYVTGGASRSPMVDQRLRARFPNVEVSRRNDPKMVVALGATLPAAITALDSTREMAVVDSPTVVKGTVVSTEELPIVPLAFPGPPEAGAVAAPGTTFDAESATPEGLAGAASEPGLAADATSPAPPPDEPLVFGTVVEADDGRTIVEPDAIGVAPGAFGSYPAPVSLAEASVRRAGPNRRRMVVIVAAALALVLAIGGIAIATSGDDTKSTAAAKPAKEQQRVVPPKVGSKSVDFDTTVLPTRVTVDRSWKLSGKAGSQLTSTLKFANPTNAVQLISYEEVVPKTIAKNAAALHSIDGAPAWVVVKPDPVLRYDMKIEANETITAGYTVAVPATGIGVARLNKWVRNYDQARIARQQEVDAFLKGLDQDSDGVPIPADACPDQPAPGIANGCPAPAPTTPTTPPTPKPTRVPTPTPDPTPDPVPQPPPPPPPAAPTISISMDINNHCVQGDTGGFWFRANTTNANVVHWTSVPDSPAGSSQYISFSGGPGWTQVIAVATGDGGEATASFDIYVTTPSAPDCP